MSAAPAIVGIKNKVIVAVHVFSPRTDEDAGNANSIVETVVTQIIGASDMAKLIMESRWLRRYFMYPLKFSNLLPLKALVDVDLSMKDRG